MAAAAAVAKLDSCRQATQRDATAAAERLGFVPAGLVDWRSARSSCDYSSRGHLSGPGRVRGGGSVRHRG